MRAVPRDPGGRMDPIHHEMHVRMVAVAMRDHHDLVLVELERGEHTIGHALHERLIDPIGRIEADGEMIDGFLDPLALHRGGVHNLGGHDGIVRREMPAGRPLDPLWFVPTSAGRQIDGESPEVGPFA